VTVDDPGPLDAVAFVSGGSGGLRRRHLGAVRTWLAIAIVGALVVPPLKGLYHTTGGTMEEGFMLYFPMRMWDGDVPNVDFLHLYGPGALHVLMLWYKAFGDTLFAERTFGLLQHLGIIFALFTLARPWGRKAATLVGALGVLYVLTPIGLTAMAWNGGLALVLWATVFVVRSCHVDGRRRLRCCVAAGFLAGFALTYRPDLVVAVVGILGWLVWSQRRHGRTMVAALVAGGVVGLVPMWVHLAMAGIGASWRGMVMDPVFHLRAGRELPRPPSWDYLDGALQRIAETPPTPWYPFPHLAASHAIFLWFFTMLAVAVATLGFAVWQRRRGLIDVRSTALLALAIVAVGILPQGLQRPDSTHLTWVTCLGWPFLVVVGAEVMRWWKPGWSLTRGLAVGLGGAVAVTVVLTPLFTLRYYALHTRVSLGMVNEPFPVERGDRRFYFGSWPAHLDSQEVIDDLSLLSRPGDRLFVGPVDLSRTWYSDVIFYWMFPELDPATYYIEMDPGLANEPGTRMAADLESADWVILTSFWAGWDEPNSSMEFGDQRPNEILRDEFCLVREYPEHLVWLYRRC